MDYTPRARRLVAGPLRRCGLGTAFVLAVLDAAAITARPETAALPAALDQYLAAAVKLSPGERSRLLAGHPVVKLLESDESKEVAAFGGVWIGAPPARYVELLTDIENFEHGGPFHATRRITVPPAAEDFAGLRLSEEDLRDLRKCRVGKCELKLGADALEAFRQVDWRSPRAAADANEIFRRLAREYVARYLEGGNRELAVYRDKDRPAWVETELRSMIDRLPPLTAALSDIRQFLLEYPHAPLPDSSDFLYWQETSFGLKPTIRINHVVVRQRPDETVVASKMLYASHYFWTALEFRVLLPDPGRRAGFWFVTVNRSRSDGLGGFMGRMLRGRVREEVERGTLAALTATKRKLETPAAK